MTKIFKEIQAILESHYKVVIKDLCYNQSTTRGRPKTECGREDIFFHINENAGGIAVSFGSWREAENTKDGTKHKIETKTLKGEVTDLKELSKQINNKENKSQEERINIIEKKVNEIIDGLKAGVTPYVTNKRIDAFSALVNQDKLLVTMTNGERTTGLQIIYSDGTKRFEKGSVLSGSYHIINSNDTKFIYVTEGYATACTVQEAINKGMAVCAFSLQNIPAVVKSLSIKYPDSYIIVCLERDLKGTAPDIKKVFTNSEQFITPEFSKLGSKGTDFNDLMLEEGMAVVQAQLSHINLARKNQEPIPLGYSSENEFFLYSRRTNTVAMFRNSIKEIKSPIANSDYWEKKFSNKRGVDYNRATDYFIDLCCAVGFYDPKIVKSYGIYEDNGIIWNNGDGVFKQKDGILEKIDLDVNSSYIYKAEARKFSKLNQAQQLDRKTRQGINDALCKFDWIDPDLGTVLLGYMVQATLAGISNWRTHIWVQGDTSTGKSYIRNNVLYKFLEYAEAADGNSTEPAIRNKIDGKSVPFIHDEAESNTKKSHLDMIKVMELHRSSNVEGGGSIIRGLQSGGFITYTVKHAACNLSINANYPTEADSERFLELFLKRDTKTSKFNEADRFLSQLPKDISARFLLTCIGAAERFLKDYDGILKFLKGKYKDYTMHRQRGMASIIAGVTSFLEVKDMATYVPILASSISKHCIRSYVNPNHQEDPLSDILGLMCPKRWGLPDGTNFRRLLLEYQGHDIYESFNLDYSTKTKILRVRAASPFLRQLCEFNDYFPRYNKIIHVISKFISKPRYMKINKKATWGVEIDLTSFMGEGEETENNEQENIIKIPRA